MLASDSYTYDSLGRLDTTTRGNGAVTKNTYTANNLVATQTTPEPTATVIEAHSYTYNAHREPATRTDTYPAGSSVAVPLSGTNTWTTVYAYDAYDRLIGSAVYAGALVDGEPTGLAATTTRYTLDVGGDVTAKTVTTRLPGPAPDPGDHDYHQHHRRLRTAHQPAGRRRTTTQTYDADGRVLTALNGNVTTYTADGAPATVTLPNGSTTVYAFWPDGSRRSAKTTGADGRVSTITLHYGTDGNLVNDSTADASTGSGTAATASYLLTTGRDARTLLPGTAPSGAVNDTPNTPITTGVGVGYYLRDRHSSVTAQIDSSGAVTGTYAYTDYGAPARADGQSHPGQRGDQRPGQPLHLPRRRTRRTVDLTGHRSAGLHPAQLQPGARPVHQPRPGRRAQPLPGLRDQSDPLRRPRRRHHHARHLPGLRLRVRLPGHRRSFSVGAASAAVGAAVGRLRGRSN